MRHRNAKGLRFEEALIEAGITEQQLLPLLAEMYRVQYISSMKLSAAAIDKRTLALVPAQIAEQRQVLPVLLDRQRSILSVVTSDPDDIETTKELEIATQVRTIRALVARPAAVEAAIRKFYLGDDFAFSLLRNENYDVARALERDPLATLAAQRGEPMLTERSDATPAPAPQTGFELEQSSADHVQALPPSMPPAYIPGRMSHPSIRTADIREAPKIEPPAPPRATSTAPRAPAASAMGYASALPAPMEPPPVPSRPPQSRSIEPPTVGKRTEPVSSPAPSGHKTTQRSAGTPKPPSGPPPSRPAGDTEDELPLALSPALARSEPPAPPPEPAPDPEDRPSDAGRSIPSSGKGEIIGNPFQLAILLVSLFEGNRRDLRGHSIQTARLVRTVCERFNVPPSRARAAEMAALIHDLGKASSYHLTPYNVARFAGHLAAAQKLHSTPARILESASLAKAVIATVTHMYERYDGTGFPGSLKGNDIPLESRILAICDSYADLTQNPRNSFRKVLSAQEACEALRESIGSVFDPKVFDRFSRAVLGDDIAQKLRGDRGTVLLVDPDVEETTVLELALIEKGYGVHVTRSLEEALRFAETGDADLVVSEMALDAGTGFELLKKVRGLPHGESIPFVFLSNESDADRVAETLDAGASDYLFKPLATAVIVAKVKRLLEQTQSTQKTRGVSGSLEEMGIPDIVQILHQGRKTGALELSSDGEQGTIYFKDGTIVDAVWHGLRGEDAFYAVVGVSRGTFTIDPTVAPPPKAIQASPEMLLLEGMRRLDEASR